jgi:hypothetical protein
MDEKQQQTILENMGKQVISLRDSCAVLEDRVKKLETAATVTSHRPSGNSSKADKGDLKDPGVAVLEDRIKALEDRNAELEDRNKRLDSEDHRVSLVQEYLNGIDADTYFAIGVRLNFLETAPAADPEGDGPESPVSELKLEDSGKTVRLSMVEPEDPQNWEHSPVLGGWVQVRND